jgi:predicted phosphoadenosine phosphosulfate sulfurtransferase
VSNLHHETAIQSLKYVQEIEPKTWAKIVDRIDGANAIKHLRNNSFTCPKDLPPMFTDWQEYALHLAANIIQEQKYYDMLMRVIDSDAKVYDGELIQKDYWKTVINTILSSDWDFTKLQNWKLKHDVDSYRRFKNNPTGENTAKFKWSANMLINNKYLTEQQKQQVYDYFKR